MLYKEVVLAPPPHILSGGLKASSSAVATSCRSTVVTSRRDTVSRPQLSRRGTTGPQAPPARRVVFRTRCDWLLDASSPSPLKLRCVVVFDRSKTPSRRGPLWRLQVASSPPSRRVTSWAQPRPRIPVTRGSNGPHRRGYGVPWAAQDLHMVQVWSL
jgi:hypothetical protein